MLPYECGLERIKYYASIPQWPTENKVRGLIHEKYKLNPKFMLFR